MTSTQPEWPAVGDKVAVFNWRYGNDGTVTLGLVERLTATQVIVEGGRRFNRARLTEVGGNEAELLPVDDERVVRVLAAGHIQQLHRGIDRLLRNGTHSPAHALALLDQADMLLADARRRLNSLPAATPTE